MQSQTFPGFIALSQVPHHDTLAAEKWKCFFKWAWMNRLVLATELDAKAEKVQVTTLLTVIGEETREVFATFTWEGRKR